MQKLIITVGEDGDFTTAAEKALTVFEEKLALFKSATPISKRYAAYWKIISSHTSTEFSHGSGWKKCTVILTTVLENVHLDVPS